MNKISSLEVVHMLKEIWNNKIKTLTESTGGAVVKDACVVSPGLKVQNKAGKLYTVIAVGPDTVVVADAGPAEVSDSEIVLQNSDGKKFLLTKEKFENDYTIQ